MANNISSFDDFKLNKQLLNAVDELGFKDPTPIQIKAIPLATAGHDVIGIAQTGTGKTAAYLLPLLMKIKYAQGDHPRALILAPTRELILQIEENIKGLAVYTDLRFVSLYGGIGPKTQIENVQKGTDIIIATPGRFLDIYLKGELLTKMIKTLVIDEADKMMDMGFMPQLKRILEIIPVKRQNLLFSATMSPFVKKLSEEFLEFPEIVEVAPEKPTIDTIDQILYEVPNLKTKINFLEYLLQDETYSRIIVFVKTKGTADNVSKYLERRKLGSVRVIHSNKGQNSRINAMNEFKEGDLRILVSTDISARGIDVSMVSHVVNFDVPIIYEDYVHRIGRTGRANNEGIAITFANKAELLHIGKIEKLINQPIPRKKLPDEVKIEKTGYEEGQQMEMDIDAFKRKENPDFKGAFHDKKPRVFKKDVDKPNKYRSNKQSRPNRNAKKKRR
ncbi:DEAD/DEAH box helicase [Fulvivirga lutimaris]|uniref:DEAD/DEAH box helicase n=1 Tax=Fulvivirga lutimaris TaxID=1819566 RepID=UPI0012BD2BA2|nr:DEAD/DEAH box helicase [Fulvivirga lutimaris]MTI39099.1 DEAD/DEAH box helicase [Fulvivirga lutimaris]